MNKIHLFLDLRKCNEQKLINIYRILRKEKHSEDVFYITEYGEKRYLHFYSGQWFLMTHQSINATEISYNQLVKMFKSGDEEKSASCDTDGNLFSFSLYNLQITFKLKKAPTFE